MEQLTQNEIIALKNLVMFNKLAENDVKLSNETRQPGIPNPNYYGLFIGIGLVVLLFLGLRYIILVN